MATFLHSRRFLSYHGNKFKDRSLLFYMNEHLAGVFPAAAGTEDNVVSHPGATFGGIAHNGMLSGTRMLQSLASAARHYKKTGIKALTYKAVPWHFRLRPCEDDIFALHAAGAERTTCQLSSVMDLKAPKPLVRPNRRRGARKAIAAGASSGEGREHVADIWNVISENLRERHGTIPSHSLEEILALANLFPQNIKFHVTLLADEVIAATVIFLFPQTWHAQYIATTKKGREVCALDLLFTNLIARAAEEGMRWFSFGISNERNGKLNESLHDFKVRFGAGGITQDHYKVTL